MDSTDHLNMAAELSGAWRGFFTYAGFDKHCGMVADLTFRGGRITGSGTDKVGWFVVTGRYSATAGDCVMTKTYPESHVVFYKGHIVGCTIAGAWWIREASIPGTFRLARVDALDAEPVEAATATGEPPLEDPDDPEEFMDLFKRLRDEDEIIPDSIIEEEP